MVSDDRRARRGLQPRRPVIAVVITAAVIAVLLAGGTTLGLFSAGGRFGSHTVTAGNLNISMGAITWRQVTPGVTDPASGVLDAKPADFVSMPGDVIELREPFTTYLQGDNMVADLTVVYTMPAGNGAVSATFHLEDSLGSQVAPTSGDMSNDSPLTVAGLLGSDAGVTASWTVVVRVTVDGDYHWVTPDSPPTTVEWSAGTILATLQQVRDGGVS